MFLFGAFLVFNDAAFLEYSKSLNETPSANLAEKKMKELEGNRRGKESDRLVLEVIRNYPGLSQYELARKLNFSSGLVDGSVRRLLQESEIFIRVLERNGRRVNLVYPKEQKPIALIEIPTKLLKTGNPVWDQNAFAYALDTSTIGVSGKEMPEWSEISCFQESLPIRKIDGKLVLQIPEKFQRFYNMERKHRVISVNGNNLLITVSGDIVEEKKYPS
jgi:DNA-binding MarR family transcriptional regulator